MTTTVPMYKASLALLTDLYQLTMAYGYWKFGRAEQRAAFNLFFRHNPFGGGYAIACGLAYIGDLLERWRLDDEDAAYLRSLRGADEKPLFDPAFVDYLRDLRIRIDIDAMAEGTVTFAHEPLLRVTGPLLQCQILETPLLNVINFQTLVATKASRVCAAARGDSVLEFGLRRAQGIDGAMAASRAAYIGGCDATSNVLAGKRFGIPVKGTHAHSWVMSFDSELEAFDAYARAMPNNCVFLVDTYDTIDGVRRAIDAARRLDDAGHRMIGIRLDSGDLGALSIEARRLLDEAGFEDARIVASNDLDERLIDELKAGGATIGVWGVGTKLVTAYDQPALGGVYKLAAIEDENGRWQPKLKLSEESIKVSTPGILQVRRLQCGDRCVADMIYEIHSPPAARPTLVNIADPSQRTTFDEQVRNVDLLEPYMREGRIVAGSQSLQQIRHRVRQQLDGFDPAVTRLNEPQVYPVGLEQSLHELKMRLMDQAQHAADTV